MEQILHMHFSWAKQTPKTEMTWEKIMPFEPIIITQVFSYVSSVGITLNSQQLLK